MKCLYKFKNITDFIVFSETYIQCEWRIDKQLLKLRALSYYKEDFFTVLVKKFKEEELTIWELKNEEVITWIDTIVLLRRILLSQYVQSDLLDDFEIIMEGLIPYGNFMRADYVFIYKNAMIVLEFGMFNQDEKRAEERYTKKISETTTYRQLFHNILDKSNNIYNYAMIYKPEYDSVSRKILNENVEYNKNECRKLAEYIGLVISKENKCCIREQLKDFDSI